MISGGFNRKNRKSNHLNNNRLDTGFFHAMPLEYSKIKIILLSVVFLSFLSGLGVAGQLVINADMQFAYAKKLMADHDYETAVVELKRFQHFFPDNENSEDTVFYIGNCYYHLKKFHDAARIFNDIILTSDRDDLVSKSVFLQSQSFMKIGNKGYAQLVLQNYLKLTEDPDEKDRIYFHLAQIHFEEVTKNHNIDSLKPAQKYLSKISPANKDRYRVRYYQNLIFKAEHAPKKNPTAAGVFSVIPGGGFLYCERFHDAAVTFLLNTGLIAAAIQAWENDNKALAGVIGFIETGFYTGNIYGSIASAHKYNQAQIMNVLGHEMAVSPDFNPEKSSFGLTFNFEF